MFVSPSMNQQSIFCFTKLLTHWTVVAWSWGMVGLNVASDVSLVFAHVCTVCAIPTPSCGIFHCLGIDQKFKRI